MPPKRKLCFGRKTLNAKRMKMNRMNETQNSREVCLEIRRNNEREIRAKETVANREIRLESKRIKANETRTRESSEQHESRIAVIRDRASTSRQALWTNLKSEAFNYKKEYDYRLDYFNFLI